ncbi:hypothetical protein BZK31_06515 [Pseudomonas floridensis]|uniref:Lipoprotein n=1 Tax=Pseudomonas floridensis TaxID=1958950 RepID=A0A1X0NAM6_9PSED|nr:hypothetical protein [Pseudomonas floridensis]ORC60409.1 hypothetical protein BZK31_06515 [Pseudomonas floridensis]
MQSLVKYLACVVLAGLAGCTFQTPPASAPDAVSRSITLQEKDDNPVSGDACTIEILNDESVYLNRNEHDCRNDQMSFYRLTDVRSATYITLKGNDCDEGGGWWFLLKTMIDPMTTELLSIKNLEVLPVGSMVAPGVRLESKKYADEDTTGKLSCVIINVSE